MTIYGYARTSTVSQVAGLADQVAKLKEAGCTDLTIYQEHNSSVKMADRVEFANVLAKLEKGDVRAAHPMNDKQTGEILPVEPHEAEWNLEVLEGLFDYFYVALAKAQQKKAALNAKLAAANKPPMK